MKLVYYSTQTIEKKYDRSSTPKILFGRSGGVTFNGGAIERIGLQDGDKITLAQDQDDLENWYVFKDPAHGFQVTIFKVKGAKFSNSQLVKKIWDQFSKGDQVSLHFLVAGQPTTFKDDKSKTQYWGIIYREKI